MRAITATSFAKINLGLRILGKRTDGYHEIRTVLQTIDLADTLVFTQAPEMALEVEGAHPIASDGSNLILKAAAALLERFPGHGARIHLKKMIPPGAGLGGGSSNAAVTLMALDRLWDLGADPGLLYSLARRLGADVPFFLYGGACLGVGRGDEIMPLPDGSPWQIIVAWPGVSLSTAEVYSIIPLSLTRGDNLSSMKGFTPVPHERSKGISGSAAASHPEREGGSPGPQPSPPEVQNDLEPVAFQKVSGLSRLKERLLEAGATAAALSGSGSAVFGLFPLQAGRLERIATALAKGDVAAFVCKTLSRDAYRLNLFSNSRT